MRHTIEHFKTIARSRGGKCISNEYNRRTEKLEWECKYGHTWCSVAGSVLSGTWCPICSEGLGEKICRFIFEKLTGRKFSKIRPKWLCSSNGTLLELDGYSAPLRVAFEHHGEQHYTTNSQFIKSTKELSVRKKLDSLKVKKCAEKGIKLIVVPEINRRLTVEGAIKYIRAQLLSHNIELLNEKFDINSFDFYYPEKYFELKKYVKAKKGKLLSKAYLGANQKVQLQCGKAHVWFATPSSLLNNRTWCLVCSGGKKKSIDEMKKLALTRGGKCLSTEYVSARKKLEWECSNGHRFQNSASKVLGGQWCRLCGIAKHSEKMRLGLVTMQKFSEQFGGVCLSSSYFNNQKKLKWQCAQGHIWWESFGNIQQKVKIGKFWCSLCTKRKTKSQKH